MEIVFQFSFPNFNHAYILCRLRSRKKCSDYKGEWRSFFSTAEQKTTVVYWVDEMLSSLFLHIAEIDESVFLF